MSDEKYQLLIVDDSITDLQMTAAFLQQHYQVAVATSGARALEMIEHQKPDLVLLDVTMPDMNGYEVCSRIRMRDKVLKVIFVSANDTTAEILKGYDVGGNDYVIKPFLPDILLSKIDQAVRSDSEIEHISHASAGLAMEAMTSLGELGAVLTFLRSSFRATSIEGLSALIKGYLTSFGLVASWQLRSENKKMNFTNQGDVTPIEDELLSRIAKMNGRFAESGVRMFINYTHATLIVKNMPCEDDLKVGRLRDNLAILLEGADEKLSILALESETENTLRFVNDTHRKIENANKTLIGNTVSELEAALINVGLTTAQRVELVNIVRRSQAEFEQNFRVALDIEDQIAKILMRFQVGSNEPPPAIAGPIDFL